MRWFDKGDFVVCAKLHTLDQEVNAQVKHFQSKYVGKYVRILSGWRKGEKGAMAVIHSVVFHHGQLLFLCMVVNKRLEIINRDAWTRTYRPSTDFELVANQPTKQEQTNE